MKKIVLKDLTLKNFQSYGNKPQKITFPAPGETMLIDGNFGAGKSSIIDGIVYAYKGHHAFDKSIINSVVEKNCEVILNQEVNDKPFMIHRGTKPAIFKVEGMNRTNIGTMQDQLDETIHITDPKVLYNICMLSAVKTLPFFELNKQARLNFLRNFVDTLVLDSLSEFSKNTHKEVKLSIAQTSGSIGALRASASRLERMVTEAVDQARRLESELRKEAKGIIPMGDDDFEDLQHISENIQEIYETLGEDITNLNLRKSELSGTISGVSYPLKKELQEFGLDLTAYLDEVQVEISDVKDKDSIRLMEIKKEIEELMDELNKGSDNEDFEFEGRELDSRGEHLKDSVDAVNKEIDSFTGEQSSLEEVKKGLETDKDSVDSPECQEYFQDLVKEQTKAIGKIKRKITALSKKKKGFEKEQGELQEELKEFNERVDRFSFLDKSIGRLQEERDKLLEKSNSFDETSQELLKVFKEYIDLTAEYSTTESSLKTKLGEHEEVRSELDKVQGVIRSEVDKRKRMEEILDELEKPPTELDKLKTEATDARRLLVEAEAKETKLGDSERLLKEYRKILDSTWAYMANKLIPMVNAKIPAYMEELEVGFTMKLDPKDISKPIFSGRPGVRSLTLKNLSNGEKRLVSLALSHALRDLEMNVHGTSVNFLFIDEFSSALNEEQVNLVLEFEKRFAKRTQTAMMLISHDPALKALPWDHRVSIVKDNYSRIHQD